MEKRGDAAVTDVLDAESYVLPILRLTLLTWISLLRLTER